jgi:hypothetical protein
LHGSGADAPRGQYEPGSHGLHSVAPVSFWYEPGSHAKHAPSPPVGATVPAAHAVGAILPVAAKKPASVGVHCAALCRSVASENEPSLHGSGADAPRGQYEPGSHGLHSVAPSAPWKVPATHFAQLDCPRRGLYVPCLQGLEFVAPI